ncbi:protein GVQW3-like [Homalodisca vitripennis]|uniref:protein GVQW3-like n=1 Tax=Homalodisca vitripennis TaxID=197043 RepID=UPI001EEAEE5C|nr:protein GVQW3-like [Homalodisca vitripennis]
MIQEAYGEDALSRTQVFRWYKNVREGRDDVYDKQRVGPPSTSHTDTNVQKVRDVLNSDRRLSIVAIADEIGIDKMTVQNIIKNDLGMRKICAKLVPKHLTDEQKNRRVAVASEILDRLQNRTRVFLTTLLQETRRGFLNTNLRRSGRVRSGKHRRHHDRKKACMSKSKVK